MSAIIAPLAAGTSVGLIGAWLASGAPLPLVIGPPGAVTVALPPGADVGAGGIGAAQRVATPLREAALFAPRGGRWVLRGRRWWLFTDDGRTFGPFPDRGRGPPALGDMGMGMGRSLGLGPRAGEAIPPGQADKFIIFVTRSYFNIANAARVYDPLATSRDIVNVGDNIAGLAQTRQAIPTPRQYMVEMVSAQTGIASIAAARRAGATMMGWDLEAGVGYTPQNELNNVARYLQMYADATHAAGMRFWVAPTEAMAMRYGPLIARYADVINLQAEPLNRSVAAFANYYANLVPQLRAINPRAQFVAQIPTTHGFSDAYMQQAFASVARVVDGVQVWTSPATIQQVGTFVSWYRANYARGGTMPMMMRGPPPMMLGPPQWFLDQQMRMERRMLREQISVMNVETLAMDLENLVAMARPGFLDPAVVSRLRDLGSRLNDLETRLEAAGIATQNIQNLDPATRAWLRAIGPRLRALRTRLEGVRPRLLGRTLAGRERAMQMGQRTRLLATARAKQMAAKAAASRAAARGRAAIRRSRHPLRRRQG